MVSLGVGTEGDDGDGLSQEDIEKAEKNLEKIAEILDCKLSSFRSFKPLSTPFVIVES